MRSSGNLGLLRHRSEAARRAFTIRYAGRTLAAQSCDFAVLTRFFATVNKDRQCAVIPVESSTCSADADTSASALDAEAADAEDTATQDETGAVDSTDTLGEEALEVDTSPACETAGDSGGCRAGVWDPVMGECMEENTNEGGSCDDGSHCTSVDLCVEGWCVGTPRVDRDDWTAFLPGA